MLEHEKAVRVTPFEYPLQRVHMQANVIPAGVRNYTYVLSNSGQLPTQDMYALVDNAAFNGDFTKNPYEFKHMNLNSYQIILNDQKIPAEAYTPDFDSKDYVREYDGLYRESGMISDMTPSCGITYKGFAEGNAIYPIDLTPDRSNNACRVNPVKNGQFRQECTFSVALPETTTALNYLVFDNTVHITQDRQPTTDYCLG